MALFDPAIQLLPFRPGAGSNLQPGFVLAGRCGATPVSPRARRPRAVKKARAGGPLSGGPWFPYFFGRMASAVPWIKALIFSTSSLLSLPVKSGMPRTVAGPLKTNLSRFSMKAAFM